MLGIPWKSARLPNDHGLVEFRGLLFVIGLVLTCFAPRGLLLGFFSELVVLCS